MLLMLSKSYDPLARGLHFVMACIILYTLSAGFLSHLVSESIFAVLSILNMSLATLALPIFCLRYVWAFFRITPKLPSSIPQWQQSFAKLCHSLMYLFMLAVFLSGFLMLEKPYSFFWLFDIQNPISRPIINAFFFEAHVILCCVLAIMVILHLLAVIKHHYLNKNEVIKLMFPHVKSNKAL